MKEVIKNTVVRTYGNLCRKNKVSNWQNHVFMSNAIEILDSQQKRIEKMEKANGELEKQIQELRVTLGNIKIVRK